MKIWVSISLVTFFLLGPFCTSENLLARATETPRVVRAVAPPYDEVLYLANVQGRVVVRATIEPSGDVGEAELVESVWDRKDWFLEYARQWKFEPMEASTTLEIVFDFKMMPPHARDDELGTTFFPPTRVEIRTRERPPLTFHR